MEASVRSRGIHRRLPIKLSGSLVSRFWASVQKGEPGECWTWMASLRSGYGAIKHAGKVFSAHRISYAIHHGEVPSGMLVMHLCNNKMCCNPSHLSAGTVRDNNRDSHAHGIKYKCGEGCWNSKLTEAKVREIWKYRAIGLGGVRISRIVGATHKQVDSVIYGHAWKHAAPNFPNGIEAEALPAKTAV